MDNYETEIEYEGKINIPNITINTNKFFKEKANKFSLLRINSVQTDESSNLSNDHIEDKFDSTIKINKNKINLKNKDINSTTTKLSTGSVNDKIKKVTFSTVEIIRVKNYKKYNKLNTSKKNENNSFNLDDKCAIY